MRKILLTAMLILIAFPSIAGNKERKSPSPYKYEVDIAWGYTPALAISSLEDYGFYVNGGLDHIYGNYISRSVTSGLMSADFNIQFKRWFALGVQFNAVVITNTENSGITDKVIGKFTDYSMSLLPYARFTYMNSEMVKLYSSVGLGIGIYHNVNPSGYETRSSEEIWPCFQLVPFGITVGKRVYGLAEIGLGTEYMGYRFGIGYRF